MIILYRRRVNGSCLHVFTGFGVDDEAYLFPIKILSVSYLLVRSWSPWCFERKERGSLGSSRSRSRRRKPCRRCHLSHPFPRTTLSLRFASPSRLIFQGVIALATVERSAPSIEDEYGQVQPPQSQGTAAVIRSGKRVSPGMVTSTLSL